ncbi:hypothetical protein [Xylanimonas ulmi]|uniref:hypothetical protein n=1 Tax=Xylanimonas ulmi TaxID=228973 RepID=UPI001A91F5EB|nr:hypothetical protein [Xylanibacterium ulmi]
MSRLDKAMRSVVDNVDGALACAVVDLGSGELLGVAHDVPYFTQEYLDAVAAASVQMFRGATVTHVEDLIAERRDVPPEHLVEEVQMTTRRTIHFLMTLPERPDAAIVLVADRRSNVGIGWAAIRRAAADVGPILGGDLDDAGVPHAGG